MEEKYLREFYTLKQLSTELKISVPTLRELVKNGELKASKVGTRYIIRREDFIALLESKKVN